MKFILKPSLEHMALVKIVILLWNQNDVRALITMYSMYFVNRDKEVEKIEKKVIEKLSELSLTHLLKEKVLGCIKPIGLQIMEWVKFHSRYFSHVNLPAELCWTPLGTVDKKKTAKVLVEDENLDIATRYKLACVYCLEDYILQFWSNMPEYLKESHCDRFSLIGFWSSTMKRNVGHTSYDNIFRKCVLWGNKEAAEYFLQKLIPTERRESLVETAKSVTDVKYAYSADVLCFLLCEMDEEQQIEVFKNKPDGVLRNFLEWPLQSCFIGVANCIRSFLSKNNFDTLLRNIIYKIRDGYKDWNYHELLREFCQESPNALKNFVTDEIDKGFLLPSLLCMKDKEITRLILKHATFKAKERLFYSGEFNYFFVCLMRDNEWDFLEFLIRECLPSKKHMLNFKEVFEKNIMKCVTGHFAGNKQKWDQLFCFSDDFVCKEEKRSESSSLKRFCSLK